MNRSAVERLLAMLTLLPRVAQTKITPDAIALVAISVGDCELVTRLSIKA